MTQRKLGQPIKHHIVPGPVDGTKLTVIEQAENSKSGLRRVRCQCECGRVKVMLWSNVYTKSAKSCGGCGGTQSYGHNVGRTLYGMRREEFKGY